MTNIHVLHWVYSNVFKSIIKVIDVVKEHTDVSLESFFCDMSEQQVITSELNDAEIERDKLVDRLCKVFLPTTNFMIQVQFVKKWQFLVSSVLPFFAEISLNPSSLHMLRFCNDVAQASFNSIRPRGCCTCFIIVWGLFMEWYRPRMQ